MHTSLYVIFFDIFILIFRTFRKCLALHHPGLQVSRAAVSLDLHLNNSNKFIFIAKNIIGVYRDFLYILLLNSRYLLLRPTNLYNINFLFCISHRELYLNDIFKIFKYLLFFLNTLKYK